MSLLFRLSQSWRKAKMASSGRPERDPKEPGDHKKNLSPSGHSHPSEAESMAGGGGRTSTVPQEPEVVTIKLQKSNNGMGLSIVAARGVGQDKLGIYIKSVVKGGAADVDGRLQAGDQLLKVDGQSLVGITQEKAAELMTQTGSVVTLEVAKQGAIYHGLAALLSQPSPIMQRGSSHGGPRRLSERDIPSRLMHDPRMPAVGNHLMPPRIQGSKSVPALNSGHPNQEPLRAPSSSNLQSHEVYNPGYSRTSSTTSIPKAMGYVNNTQDSARAHSTSNLRQEPPPHDVGQRYPYPSQGSQPPPPYSVSGSDSSARSSGTQQNFQQTLPRAQLPQQEERHYQNISLYQQQPAAYGSRPSPQPYPPHLQAPRGHHGSHSSLQHSDHFQPNAQPQMDRVRPVSALVSPREQEQYANSMGYPHTLPPQRPPPSPHRAQPPPYAQYEPQGQPGYPQRPPESREYRSQHDVNQYQDGEPPAPEMPPPGHPPPRGYHQDQYSPYGTGPPVHPHGTDPRHRDLIRQEAKMEEMREEVRRREERERNQQNLGQPVPQWGPPQPRPPVSNVANARYIQGNSYGAAPHYGATLPPQQPARGPNVPPPPPPSKPRLPHPGEKPVRPPYGYDHRYDGQSLHPLYRDSPPPAPPISTHPLHQQGPHPQQQQQQPGPPPPAVSYRYGPSGYPPRQNEAQNQRPNPPVSRFPQAEPKQVAPAFRHPATNSNQNQRSAVPEPQLAAEKKLVSPSPWEREEKEKISEGCTSPPPTTSPLLLQQQRLEEARRARDEEISELEDQPNRTLKQEERLRALRLEQEFQRRAEESKGDDDEDEDDDLLDRAESRERMLRMQEDLERTRQRRIEWEQNQLRQQQQQQQQQQLQQQQKQNLPQQQQQEDWSKQNNHSRQRSQLEEQEGRLRHLRLEEVSRKQELQAAKDAEERLLREARRRQEEDLKNQRNLQLQQSHPSSAQPHGQQPAPVSSSSQSGSYHRLESLISGHQDVPPPLPSSPPPPLEPTTSQPGTTQMQYSHFPPASQYPPSHSSGSQRLDKLLLTTAPSYGGPSQQSEKHAGGPPPPPPERKSSYEVTSQLSSGTRLPSSLRNGETPQVHVAKKVSWNDTRFEVETNGNSNGSTEARDSSGYSLSGYNTSSAYEDDSGYTLEDIDEVLSTPGSAQQTNTYSTGSTPGVIGAQEVYRDPRQRIEAERQQMQQEFKSPGPEKLSFREKMKMFAKETGEPNSPRDRMKISRAQRDIENNLNGT